MLNRVFFSDPIAFDLQALAKVVVTIYFGEISNSITGHPGSGTTSFWVAGNEVANPDLSDKIKTDHWYVINTLEVKASPPAAAVAILGDSITGDRGSGVNKQNRWPDILAQRLHDNPETKHIGVLNQGIGGNCVSKECLGPSGVSRFDRDTLNQHGVRWIILLAGVNDIGSKGGADIADKIITSYNNMIDKAHAKDIKVFGATLTPIKNSFYYSHGSEFALNRLNNWIRNSGRFDAVIDMNTALSDAENPATLLPLADAGDHLHPNEYGYQFMGETVDLGLFK